MYTVRFVSPTGINAAAYVSKKSPVSSPYSYQLQNIDSSYNSVRTSKIDTNGSNQQKKQESSTHTDVYRRDVQNQTIFNN